MKIEYMKKYKVRFNCTSFYDAVVQAKSKKDAIEQAHRFIQCPQNGMEFGEFLPVEEGDEIEN